MATYLTHGADGARLHELIAAADAINHAIPTANELSRAFTKFVRVELVEMVGDRFRFKGGYYGEIEKAYSARGGLSESPNKGEKWLKRMNLAQINEQQVVISSDEAQAAYEKYTSSIKND